MSHGFARQNFNFAQFGGTAVSLGQKVMASSIPVVVASNQSAVPVTDNSGSLTVDQSTHDNLQANANLQVANTDVANANPVPVSDASGSLTVDQATASSLNAQAVGNIAHDSADSGNPMKLGGKAFSFETTTDSTPPGQTAVGANDRVNLALNLRGEVPITRPAIFYLLTDIDDTYDNTTTTNTSSAVNTNGYSKFMFGFELDRANTPTDITFEVQADLGGGVWMKVVNWALGDWIYDDLAVGASGIEECYFFEATADQMRVVVTATGTTASNTFLVDDSILRCMA